MRSFGLSAVVSCARTDVARGGAASFSGRRCREVTRQPRLTSTRRLVAIAAIEEPGRGDEETMSSSSSTSVGVGTSTATDVGSDEAASGLAGAPFRTRVVKETTPRESETEATGNGDGSKTSRARRRRKTPMNEKPKKFGLDDAEKRGRGVERKPTMTERWTRENRRMRRMNKGDLKLLTGDDERVLSNAIQTLLRIERGEESLKDEDKAKKIEFVSKMDAIEALAAQEKMPKESRGAFEARLAESLGYDNVAAMRADVKAGKNARKRLVSANMGLVATIGGSCFEKCQPSDRGSLSKQDMIHEGVTGLIRASELFDPARGYKFSTYASTWIWRDCMRSANANGRLIKIPEYLLSMDKAASRVKDQLQQRLGREVTMEEVMNASSDSNLTVEKLEQLKDLKTLKGTPISIDSSVYSKSGDGIEFTDPNAGSEGDVLVQDLENDFLRDEIVSALGSLKPKEALVIKYRFGLSGEPMSRSEVAEKLGMSFEGIRQCENRAMDKLRAPKVTRSLVAHLDEADVPSSEKPAEKPKKTKTRRSKKAPPPTSAIDLVRSIQL